MSEKDIEMMIWVQLSNYIPGECSICNFEYKTPSDITKKQGRYIGKLRSGLHVIICDGCWKKVNKHD